MENRTKKRTMIDVDKKEGCKKDKPYSVWHDILEGDKILSDKEAEELEKETKRLRKKLWS